MRTLVVKLDNGKFVRIGTTHTGYHVGSRIMMKNGEWHHA